MIQTYNMRGGFVVKVWVMAEDREERCTKLTETFVSAAQARGFKREEEDRHKRNGVKARVKVWPVETAPENL